MNKLERQNQIIQSIQNSDKMTASQLAKLFKVSKRTILRDIDDLEEQGVKCTHNTVNSVVIKLKMLNQNFFIFNRKSTVSCSYTK